MNVFERIRSNLEVTNKIKELYDELFHRFQSIEDVASSVVTKVLQCIKKGWIALIPLQKSKSKHEYCGSLPKNGRGKISRE